MTTELPRERRTEERPEAPEGRPERFERSAEPAAAIAESEYRGISAEIADAERQATAMMEAALDGLDEVPFELKQLKRDCDDFLRENAAVMRGIAEEAKREASAVIETKVTTENAKRYLALLDRDFFPAAKAAVERLPDALKNDSDAVVPLLNDMFEAAGRKDEESWQEINAQLDYMDLQAAASSIAERYAGVLEGVGEAPRLKFMEQYLGKRLTALERARLSPDDRRAAAGGARHDVQMVLELTRRLPLSSDKRERVVLRAAAKNGPSVVAEFPDLAATLDARQLEDAIVEAAPRDTVLSLPQKTVARQVELLGLLAEMHPSSALEGLKQLPDMHEDVQVRILVKALSAQPALAERLDELALSSYEKLALGMRIARQNPDAFPDFMRSAAPSLSPEERSALVQDLLDADVGLFRAAAGGFALSHAETVDVIRRAPEERRATLLDALGIPGKDAEFMLDEARAHSIPERPETREDVETARIVEKVDRASVDLMLAMERTVLGSAEAERECVGEEQRLHGRIRRIGVISGSSANSPRYVMIEGRELPAVYKSRLREQKIRHGIPEGGMVGREVLASFIDRALQLNLVPATVLRNGPEGLAAVQDWKVGDIAAKTDWRADENREQLKRLGFFDWLTQNSDRHTGNWLIGKDGRHSAIDNGSIFGERVHESDKLRSFPLTEVHGSALPDELRERAADLLENNEVLGILKEMFSTLLGAKDGKRAWKEFEGRLHRAADPDFRLPDSEWTVAHAALGKQ